MRNAYLNHLVARRFICLTRLFLRSEPDHSAPRLSERLASATARLGNLVDLREHLAGLRGRGTGPSVLVLGELCAVL